MPNTLRVSRTFLTQLRKESGTNSGHAERVAQQSEESSMKYEGEGCTQTGGTHRRYHGARGTSLIHSKAHGDQGEKGTLICFCDMYCAAYIIDVDAIGRKSSEA